MRGQAACCAAHATPTACRRPWPIANGDGDRSASWTSEARLSRTGLGRLSILAGDRPEAARSPERFDPGEPPDAGTGKPAPLRGPLSGWWSRRLTKEHRLVYRPTEDALLIAQCRYH